MGLFTLEHSRAAYRADFVLYGAATLSLATYLAIAGPASERASILGLVLMGLVAWSVLEYALHRFVLHRLQPFRRWHAEHHLRPTALIGTPTILTASLFSLLVLMPAWLLGDRWQACALMLGVLSGYLAYAVTHHGVHHARRPSAWVLRRRRWHALHHQRPSAPEQAHAHYGVTTGLWDHVFGSARRQELVKV